MSDTILPFGNKAHEPCGRCGHVIGPTDTPRSPLFLPASYVSPGQPDRLEWPCPRCTAAIVTLTKDAKPRATPVKAFL